MQQNYNLENDENKFLSDLSLKELADQQSLQNFKIAGGISSAPEGYQSLVELYDEFKSSQDKIYNIALYVDEHILSVNFKKDQFKQTIVTVANSSQDGQLTYSITSDNKDETQVVSEVNEKILTIINASKKFRFV